MSSAESSPAAPSSSGTTRGGLGSSLAGRPGPVRAVELGGYFLRHLLVMFVVRTLAGAWRWWRLDRFLGVLGGIVQHHAVLFRLVADKLKLELEIGLKESIKL